MILNMGKKATTLYIDEDLKIRGYEKLKQKGYHPSSFFELCLKKLLGEGDADFMKGGKN